MTNHYSEYKKTACQWCAKGLEFCCVGVHEISHEQTHSYRCTALPLAEWAEQLAEENKRLKEILMSPVKSAAWRINSRSEPWPSTAKELAKRKAIASTQGQEKA